MRLIVATHHKCASNPLTRVLKEYSKAKGLIIQAIEGSDREPVAEDCDILFLSNATYAYCVRCKSAPRVHIFRNPLDMIVSAYYSHLRTHDIQFWPALAVQRKVLEHLSKEQGMISTAAFLERPDFNEHVPGPLTALRGWNFDDNCFVNVRMEDLVRDPLECLRRVAPGLFDAEARSFFDKMSFESLAHGRKLGQVDNYSHFRSGLPNQWKNELPHDLAVSVGEAFRPMLARFYPDTLKCLEQDHHLAKAGLRTVGDKLSIFRRFTHSFCPTRDI